MKRELQLFKNETIRIDENKATKRNESIIEEYHNQYAKINDENFLICNSNDYLNLKENKEMQESAKRALETYGIGTGSVRFISGSTKSHKELEKNIADFHDREDAITFSSAFAANTGTIQALVLGTSKESIVNKKGVLLISDSLNHRSIIDGIRLTGLEKNQKLILPHSDMVELEMMLEDSKGKYDRVIIISDGVFSMTGEHAKLDKIQALKNKYNDDYNNGILTIVDDSHGVAAYGEYGRGTEEICNIHADILIATFGKGFGCEGGYVVADKIIIDYLRESAATYIYSNALSPISTAAASTAIEILSSEKGRNILQKMKENIDFFKSEMKKTSLKLVCDSIHPVQAILIGDTKKTKLFVERLQEQNMLCTVISYPVVPKGKDEIRIQLNVAHTKENLRELVTALQRIDNELNEKNQPVGPL